MILKTPLWKRTPPAIFPVCLGYLGLAFAWYKAADFLPVSPHVGHILLGISVAFFGYFFAFYLAKLIGRPSVILGDLKAPPLRAGLATIPMSILLMAFIGQRFGLNVTVFWWIGAILQLGVFGLVVRAILQDPPQARGFSPFLYLTFVGPVIGTFAAINLGYTSASFWLSSASVVAFVIISAGIIRNLLKALPPQPLRPSLAIAVAPPSLFALSFGPLGMTGAFELFYWIACALFVAVLLALPWMTKGGWTPLWGALAFPLAVFANLQIAALANGFGTVALVLLVVVLLVATPLIFYVIYRSSMAWVTGMLSEKSGAAVV